MFLNYLKEDDNYKRTENGATVYKSTTSPLLDYFAQCGALRTRNENDKRVIFDEAYRENNLLATKILFYSRDIREGLGERETFRVMLNHAAQFHPEAVIENIDLIPEYGRYDDWYVLIGTQCEADMWKAMKKRFDEDWELYIHKKPVSLLAKWIKTADASSKETRKLGILTAIKLGYRGEIKVFKRKVRDLRRHIKVTETYMSANKWSDINYEAVPSKASFLYKKAFLRHDEERYTSYLDSVKKGEKKIHAATLFPYEIIREYRKKRGYDETLELQWRNLPNYVGDDNALVVCDTSGSMTWGFNYPLDYSVGLAIYFAERNRGEFHNYFLEFSSESSLIKLRGETLRQKYDNVMRDARWGGSTNLEAAFNKILKTAVSHRVPQQDMPKSLIIITDMEVNNCVSYPSVALDRSAPAFWNPLFVRKINHEDEIVFYEAMKERYRSYGYEMPNVVFWNVSARHDTFHVKADNPNVQLISGGAATQFKNLAGIIGKTPYAAMEEIINSERYAPIKIADMNKRRY